MRHHADTCETKQRGSLLGERVRDRLGPSQTLAAARRLRFATASESAVLPIRRTGGFVHTTDSAKQKTPLTRGSLWWRGLGIDSGRPRPSPLRGASASLRRPNRLSCRFVEPVGSSTPPTPPNKKTPLTRGSLWCRGLGIDSGHPGPRRCAAPPLRCGVRIGCPAVSSNRWVRPHHRLRQTKNPADAGLFVWRRGWDSNPRGA